MGNDLKVQNCNQKDDITKWFHNIPDLGIDKKIITFYIQSQSLWSKKGR